MDREVCRAVPRGMMHGGSPRLRRFALALAIPLVACSGEQEESLVFTIEQALATNPEGADLGRIIGGDWDRVCVFRADTPSERVDSAIGARRETAVGTRESTDSAALLVFVRGTTVVKHARYPVRKGDFGTPGPATWYCRPREDAVFQLRHPIDGAIPWIGPVEAR